MAEIAIDMRMRMRIRMQMKRLEENEYFRLCIGEAKPKGLHIKKPAQVAAVLASGSVDSSPHGR
jgi:hypothetical protein